MGMTERLRGGLGDALPEQVGALAGIAAARAVGVGPAVARLAGGAEVDVDEPAAWVLADAHAASIERLGELVDVAVRDALDGDVHGRAVEVAAALVALVAEGAVDRDGL